MWPAAAFVAAYEMAVYFRKRQDATRRDSGDRSDIAATTPTGSAKARDILKTSPTLPKADVAEMAAVSLRTVERVKRELNGAVR